jgi:hypothetical protein
MEILRMGHDIFGRPVLEGVAWDLVAIAAVLGVVVVLGHALYRLIRGRPEGE